MDAADRPAIAIRERDELVLFFRGRQTSPEIFTRTLTKASVARLLDSLFAQADATRPETMPISALTSPEERDRLMPTRANGSALSPLPRMSNCRCGSAEQPYVLPTRDQAFAQDGIAFGPKGDGYEPVGVETLISPTITGCEAITGRCRRFSKLNLGPAA